MGYMCRKGGSKECDGCGACQPEEHYFCPICDSEVFETVFVSSCNGEVIGCENCAEIKEPHEVLGGEG